ncbi:MAG TPA: ParM/StbA family protein [Methanoregulaceae archaeon]|nr:ParM/StbA family protein [Methanothrix sp.]HOK07916.1 ParM/StbA family protein [Syntrophales bacterium]HOL44435.1 ParM/StbA family protein [Methanothrix sp.]HON93830.1 ParM/StbA family protein [Sedimentisphaerales bacterium]HPD11279.1 ParM/StbA family protein [Methanoregulaceae archaeon]
MNEEKTIGIDIGYGLTKSYCHSGGDSFPTSVTSLVPEETFGVVRPWSVNGESYLVGKNIVSQWLMDPRSLEFPGSNAWLAVLGYVLFSRGFLPENIKDGRIVIGLPPGHFRKNYVSQIQQSIKNARMSFQDYEYDLSDTEVVAIPQGAGIYYSYLVDGSSGSREKVAVVDIGHYTIDAVYFSQGTYVEEKKYSYSLGVSVLLDNICAAFQGKYDWTIGHSDALRLLMQGQINILQETVSVDQISDILDAYATKVASIIDRYISTLPELPDIGIVGGGGVYILKNRIKLKRHLYIVTDPVVSNAKGYYYYGTGRVTI